MRRLGKVLGTALVIKGMVLALSPRYLFKFYREYLGNCTQCGAKEIVEDYEKLSDRSLSYLGVGLTLVGVTVLSLASREKEENKS